MTSRSSVHHKADVVSSSFPVEVQFATDVTKAKRKLLKKYHPDKHQVDADCAHKLSMWIMAGAELLKEHERTPLRTNQ